MSSAKLDKWKRRLADNETEYEANLARMDHREDLYQGQRRLKPLTDRDMRADGALKETPHVRNIIAENIESQVSSVIPQPKVTARRKKDEKLAKLIEDMIRNELDRMPMEYINDIQERTVPIQGGSFYHVEWDNAQRTHTTVGELNVTARHPKQVIPQAGVYTGLGDMDFVILKLPTTRAAIRRQYGVGLMDSYEEEPEIRGKGEDSPQKDLVTLYIGYERNDDGTIARYAWACDTELEDLEDYQARRLRRCVQCGEVEPVDGSEYVKKREMVIQDPMAAAIGYAPEMVEETATWHTGDPCPYCGGKKWRSEPEDYEEIWDPIITSHGTMIPGAQMVDAVDENGVLIQEMKPTKIPFYKPNTFPLVLQRNVSLFGQLLGDSDVDKIEDQQNTVNRIEKKIIDRLVTAGTRVCMPASARHRIDTEDQAVWYFDNPADANIIRDINFTGNLQYEMAYLAQAYEEARQIIGITDSFQGRTDSTATSGKAKEFAAAQSAGRLESKRVMKDAAYAELFRMMFLFKLAYADEPRPVVSQDSKGNTTYDEFNRYDFLEQDADGQWYWKDGFLFSTDVSAPLANNRERMWQETISLFSAGCFGDPAQLETLIALWTKMELLHYPGAGDTRAYLEEKLQAQQAQIKQQMAMQQAQMEAQMQAQQTVGGNVPAEVAASVEEQARQDAMAAAMGGGNPEQNAQMDMQALAQAVDQQAAADAAAAVMGGSYGA